MLLVLVAVSLLPALVAFMEGSSIGRAYIAGWEYLALVWAIVLVFVPIAQRVAVSRLYRTTPSLQQEQTHQFSELGFRTTNPLANTDFRWDAIVRMAETRDFFLFYVSKSIAIFLPKRVLQPGELHDLRALLKTQLGRLGRPADVFAA
jgi:hypothetical protein